MKSDYDAKKIQSICRERGITTLCHFTRVQNLESIFQRGLLTRTVLEMLPSRQQPVYNDDPRLDGHENSISLSIEHPNYKMFYYLRGKTAHNSWAVLSLKAIILWELDCGFCKENAASFRVSDISLPELRQPQALRAMFEDYEGIRRQNLGIPDHFPTHPQAEVLVFDAISPEFITAVSFYDGHSQSKWLPRTSGVHSDVGTYFGPRQDYMHWQGSSCTGDAGIGTHWRFPSYEVDTSTEEDIPF